jgi:GNAT superfamily N-acetyltransferase
LARSVHPINDTHDCRQFKCGKHPLDRWLSGHALRNEKNNVSRTRVLVDEGGPKILGFYSLAATILELDCLPPDLRSTINIPYPAPAILLAQLAVHRDIQSQGIGRALLAHALQTAADAADRIGAMAVAVDAIDEGAEDFYTRFGFLSLAKDGRHLFLPLSGIPRPA